MNTESRIETIKRELRDIIRKDPIFREDIPELTRPEYAGRDAREDGF
jgi:hypothetical protein